MKLSAAQEDKFLRQSWLLFGLGLIIVVTFSGCAIFRAIGSTVESVGEGAATVVRGVGDGFGKAVGGTGRAVSNAASGKSENIKGTAQETAEEISF